MTAPTIQIRLLEARDLKACVRLYQDAYAAPPYASGWSDDMATRILHDLRRHFPEECFVAESGGEILGFILCSSLADLRATIEEFAVAPEHQRRGVGRKLLDHVIDLYRVRKVPFLELIANTEAPAYRFYRRMGFAAPDDYRLMSKELK